MKADGSVIEISLFLEEISLVDPTSPPKTARTGSTQDQLLQAPPHKVLVQLQLHLLTPTGEGVVLGVRRLRPDLSSRGRCGAPPGPVDWEEVQMFQVPSRERTEGERLPPPAHRQSGLCL